MENGKLKMENWGRRAVVLLLALCMTISLVPMSASAAVSGQDAYYLERLKPKSMPRATESYPAKLILTSAMPFDSPVTLELKGTLGLNAELTDEEIVAILKQAVSAVKSYTSPQSACDDLVLVEELTEKLKFSKEDMDEIIKNWEKLLGVDIIADLLSGKLPSIDAADVVNSLIDAAGGDIPMNPKPGMPGWGTVVDGVFISFEEYQKDQQKYQDIIKLSQANERLNAYNSRVRGLIRDKMKEKGGWRLEINDQKFADMKFDGIEGNKQIWTADIDLNKTDSDLTTAGGTYTGQFKLTLEGELSKYDSDYDDYHAAVQNGTVSTMGGFTMPNIGNAYTGTWEPAGVTGSPSEMKVVFDIPDCSLSLSMPTGTLRTFFELPLSTDNLFMSEYQMKIDRTATIVKKGQNFTMTETINRFTDGETSGIHFHTVIDITGGQHDEWDEGDSSSGVMDLSEYLSMKLVIDMLGK
jgi:hypothetical protein